MLKKCFDFMIRHYSEYLVFLAGIWFGFAGSAETLVDFCISLMAAGVILYGATLTRCPETKGNLYRGQPDRFSDGQRFGWKRKGMDLHERGDYVTYISYEELWKNCTYWKSQYEKLCKEKLRQNKQSQDIQRSEEGS